MPEGVIVGGWPSVIAAYSITAVVLGLYVWSLFHRSRGAVRPASVPAVSSEEDVDDD